MEEKDRQPGENIVAGAVGALLGALIGVACIVVMNRLGYVASIGGVVMAVCTLEGYALLSRRRGSKVGAVISTVLVLLMTYIAHNVTVAMDILAAFSEEGVDFFTAYRSIELFLEEAEIARMYWGNLAMLYLFTLLGAVPTLLSLRKGAPASTLLASVPLEPEPPEGRPVPQGEVYSLNMKWTRPVVLSVGLSAVAAALAALSVLFRLSDDWVASSRLVILLPLGALAYVAVLFCTLLSTTLLCNSANIVYLRVGDRLWRADVNKLYRVAADWTKLAPQRREALERDLLRQTELWPEGLAAHRRPGALIPLDSLRVERENKWCWRTTYRTASGRRRRLTIVKGYPGFSPEPGREPAQGPLSPRWGYAALILLSAAAVAVGGFLLPLSGRASGGSVEPGQGEEPPARIAVRTPESVTEFEMSEVSFQMDAQLQYARRTFLDSETGTFYRAYVQYGVDEHDAWDTLLSGLGKYRTSPLYDRFEIVYQGQESLAPLDQSSRYNIVSVYLTDGRVFHTAAVLSEDGTLFTLEASHDTAAQKAKEVLGSLMFTLKSVRFMGPAVTEENYRSQLHLSQARELEFMASAYIKTDLFGHDAFVDVYIPYSDAPVYSDDGEGITSQAHGLEVFATVISGQDAKSVVGQVQRELDEDGWVYQEVEGGEAYREDLDAACKLIAYEEDGHARYTLLYADAKWEGYYLFRGFTVRTELVDGDYLAVLTELEQITSLSLPHLRALAPGDAVGA